MNQSYVVCGYKSWNRQIFDDVIKNLPGEWHFIGSKEELTMGKLRLLSPRYVFFLHWSWIVPKEVLNAFECVNFHMTDLPYGRGGSPLQNLILRGHDCTKLTAHRMAEKVDEGPVYLKEDLSLAGSAEEILERANTLSVEMIQRIVGENPNPQPQTGTVVHFTRRMPEESTIPPAVRSQKELYDFIRMLDAEGYPHAFFERDGFRYTFRNARVEEDQLKAEVTIVPSDSPT